MAQYGESEYYTLTESDGGVWKFRGFTDSSSSWKTYPLYERGSFESYTPPSGASPATVAGRWADGRIAEIDRGVESFVYGYDSAAAPHLTSVTLKRTDDKAGWNVVGSAEYAYYGQNDSHGNQGDLKLVVVSNGAGTALDKSMYRYEIETNPDKPTRLRFSLGGDAYERARGPDGKTDPLGAEDSDLWPMAQFWFNYKGDGKVDSQWIAGTGNDNDPAGRTSGRIDFTYGTRGGVGFNVGADGYKVEFDGNRARRRQPLTPPRRAAAPAESNSLSGQARDRQANVRDL